MELTFPWKKDALHYTIYINGIQNAKLDITNYVQKQFKPSEVIRKYNDQGRAYIWLPSGQTENIRVPVVVAAHGSGRGADDYVKTDFYVQQREIAKQYGYGFAVISNDRDGWGTDDGTTNLINYCKNLPKEWPILDRIGIWATSAGGVTALRTIASGECDVDFYIGTFPVYDLKTEYRILPSCRAAFGDYSIEAFAEQINGKNPPDLTHALLASGCRFYITHGSADQAVPIQENSLRFIRDLGDTSVLEVIPGGVHSTDDYSYYGKAVEQAFKDYPAMYTFTTILTTSDVLQLKVEYADGSTTTENFHVDENGMVIPRSSLSL